MYLHDKKVTFFLPTRDIKGGIFIASGHALVDIGKIEQNSDGKLQIKYADNSYLTLDTTGNLNTKSITAESITATTNFSLKGEECEFATIDDFKIDLIE